MRLGWLGQGASMCRCMQERIYRHCARARPASPALVGRGRCGQERNKAQAEQGQGAEARRRRQPPCVRARARRATARRQRGAAKARAREARAAARIAPWPVRPASATGQTGRAGSALVETGAPLRLLPSGLVYAMKYILHNNIILSLTYSLAHSLGQGGAWIGKGLVCGLVCAHPRARLCAGGRASRLAVPAGPQLGAGRRHRCSLRTNVVLLHNE